MTDREVLEATIAVLGTTRIAKMVGARAPQTVQGWRKEGRVPGAWRFAMRKLANQRAGLNLPLAWLDPRKASS